MIRRIACSIMVLTLALPSVSHANVRNETTSVPSLAILDTGLDTSIPSIKEKLIYEVCILEWTTCPNGQSFMEGPGSTHIPLSSITKNGFEHGTQMASAALSTNKNINIVFVRIIGQNINGDRQIANEKTVYNALNWVLANKDRFNIQAVSLAQGHQNLLPSPNYCPTSPETRKSINDLLTLGIPTFAAIGNSYNYSRIDWPSCIPESIAIGAGSKSGIELYNNYDPALVDFYSTGNLLVSLPGNLSGRAAGSSIATQVAAASWIAVKQSNPTLTTNQLFNLISEKSRIIKMSKKLPQVGKLFDLRSVLN